MEWRNLRPQWYQCLPLPLSFRPERSKAEWSGEISGPNGTSASPSHCHFDRNGAKRSGAEKSPAPCCSPIAMGDLSAQSNNRFQTPLSPYRHAAPLEMTYEAGSSTVMGKGNNDTIPRPTVISTETEQSGVEWRNLRSQWYQCLPRSTVISTGTEQSGVEWRNLRPQWYQCLPLPLSFRPERSKAEWSGEISSPHAADPLR